MGPLLPDIDWLAEAQRETVIVLAGETIAFEFTGYLEWLVEHRPGYLQWMRRPT